ncbi:ent-kaur-16-ene synthase, chloroplastic-like isoform X1 [Phragmites australis]|uniref:ent-kaur-16-ene synthase, chloroplastic-like isoform X1 n=1 Tax=Phragmites australis TaxID=29695 RepID=UPI002D773B5B|nr:ent-kaur-16-ene synthase, chloroplastic-like isoform X1 [Phragmites australis]
MDVGGVGSIAKVVKLTGSLTVNACCHLGGHRLTSSPFGTMPTQLIRASRPRVDRVAQVQKTLEVGECATKPAKRVSHSSGMQHKKGEETRLIRKQLQGVELPPSYYDTAWVAMVALQGSPHVPRFPQCVEWILQHQEEDGSWGRRDQFDSSVSKDVLSSTLACVLALGRWNVGREHIMRGLHFIGRNLSIVMDDQIVAPIGFNITFPGMLSSAIEMGLEVPILQTDIDRILRLQEMELTRDTGISSYGRKAYLAYVTEGLGNKQDWSEVMKFQRKNGSLFNSPSATAAALLHNHDTKALQYIDFLIDKFGSAVPTAYPKNIHSQLSMVDVLENMGISRHFTGEIKCILDMTYSCWLRRDEEIILDATTCAIAFRILRMNGYNVSSDELSHVAEASGFHNSLEGYLNDTRSLLELHKASKVSISEDEFILDSIGSWSGCLLKEQLRSGALQRTPLFREVEHALNCPFYTTLDRLDHRRNIENFDVTRHQMLKTSYLSCHTNQDILALGVRDFSSSQFTYQQELQHLDSWVKESRLDQLPFARQKLAYFYLSAAGTIFPPELSDARILWAINGVLTTVVDDFFDVGGSKEELENLVTLVEMWDEHHKIEFYSEQVEIVFSAIYTSVNQLGAKASAVQERNITKHLVETWLDLLRSMMTEVEWRVSKYVPTAEEYMKNAFMTFGLGPIVLPALYFVGPKISESVVRDPEYNELFRLMSTCGRLLNDAQTYEREDSEGKVNSVSLLVLHSGGSMSIEEARREMQKSIDTCRRDLLRLVLKEESAVPKPCKELFWKMCKVCHFFYFQSDGFSSSEEKAGEVDAVINEPLQLKGSSAHVSVW